MLELKRGAGNDWPIAIAKFIMEPYNASGDYANYYIGSNLIIYNDLYDGDRKLGLRLIGWSGPYWKYYNESNDYLWAANLLDHECTLCTNQDEVLYLKLLAYYNLTYDIAFIPQYDISSQTFGNISQNVNPADYTPTLVLDHLDLISSTLVTKYPDSQYTPEALSVSAIGHANMRDLQKSIDLMTRLINLYPKHSLANNASIYIARTYHKLAKQSTDSDLKSLYYANAKGAYEFTSKNYPTGHVGKEAFEELAELLKEMSQSQ